LRELRLHQQVLQQGARIDRLLGKAVPSGRTVLDVRYASLRSDAYGVGIHRGTLFQLLYDAAIASGVEFQVDVTIASSEINGSTRGLLFSDGSHSKNFDLVVDCLGTRSPLAPPCGRDLAYGALWTNVDWIDSEDFTAAALEQRYYAASRMIGVMPIGFSTSSATRQAALFWSLRSDRYEAWKAAGLSAWKAEVENLWPQTRPLLEQIVDPEQLTYAQYAHRTLPQPRGERIIHIGDAWHSTSPQLGQGANMALLDALALAQSLRTESSVSEALSRAIKQRRFHVSLYQSLSAWFTPVYQSDSRVLPVIRDSIVGPLSRVWPATWLLAAMVCGQIGE
jgi:2-polyprenyl-6-methoxyphenol hydroxylase-like FAD-dependent oxidoreductase